MPQPIRIINAGIWLKLIAKYSSKPVKYIFVVWILCLMLYDDKAQVFHDDLLAPHATMLTVILIFLAILESWRAIAIAQHGVEIEATTRTDVDIDNHGMVNVELAFMFNDRPYSLKYLAPPDSAPKPGETVALLVDRTNPERHLIRDEVFTDRT